MGALTSLEATGVGSVASIETIKQELDSQNGLC